MFSKLFFYVFYKYCYGNLAELMIDIRPNCVQNIRQNLSKQRFGIYNSNIVQKEPVFRPIDDKFEMNNVLDFFISSFNQTAGNAGLSSKTNWFSRTYEKCIQKIWLLIEKKRALRGDADVEVVQNGDKILGCYSLSYEKNKSYINFLAVNPDIKNSKMTVKTLLNMANRISEKTKSKGLNTISWTTDRRNKKAYMLFDKFPAYKHSGCASVDFSVSVSNFDHVLNKYM